MLVLTRKLEEQIRIGDNITISILRVQGNTVRVGIDAPREVRVVRGELPIYKTNPALSEGQTTADAAVQEKPQDEEDQPGDTGFSDPATSAVRKFLTNRARRNPDKPESHRPASPTSVVASTALTRSA